MTVQRFLCHSILLASVALTAQAQNVAAHSPAPRTFSAQKPSFALPVAPASVGAPAPGHSLLEQPAEPAKITLESGRLSVSATNASLTQTLREISTTTGTQIEGLSKDQRVFGIYGPGSPQEVLTALLDDSGYNVLMVGRLAGGAPRQLVLSARASSTVAIAATTTARPSSDEDDDETPPTPPTAESQPVPAVAPPAAAPGAPVQPGQVKTPQQMLEELQQLHRGQDAPALPRDQPQ